MCGIVGVLAFGQMADKKEEKARQFAMRFLGTELLKMTQERGKDATGVATLFDNGDYMGLKMGIPSEDFAARFGKTEKDFQGYMDIWRRKKAQARVFIGHCRKSSVGNSDDNKNNHPIKVGDVVGIHNGTLTNHEEIFKRLACGRDGTVDSEAIFRLIHHYTNNGTLPFTLDIIEEVCKRLSGAFACLAFSGNNPFQVVAFRDGRPMEFCIIRPLKLVLIASEQRFVKRTMYRYNQMAALYVESGHNLPVIHKADATLNTTTDLWSYVFDLRKDVGDTTEVGDLFEKRKLPLTDKLWKLGTKTTASYSNTVGNAAATTGAAAAGGTKKRTEVAASSPASGTSASTETKNSTQDPTDRQAGGLAWNRQSKSYGSVSDDEEAVCRSYGTVGINNNTGEVVNIDSEKVITEGEKNPEEGFASNYIANPIKKVSGPVDTLIDSPANVTEIDVVPAEDPIIAVSSNKKGSTGSALLDHVRNSVVVEEVDFSTHPDVLELAEDAAREEANFSNDGEVQESLEIKNADALKNLPLYSLANRIKRFFFRKGFYCGYLACLETGNKDGKDLQRNMLKRATNKVKSAQETIRQSKSLMSVLDKVMESGKVDEGSVRTALEDAIAGGTNITAGGFKRVCKPGDLKKSKVLSMVASALDSIEGR